MGFLLELYSIFKSEIWICYYYYYFKEIEYIIAFLDIDREKREVISLCGFWRNLTLKTRRSPQHDDVSCPINLVRVHEDPTPFNIYFISWPYAASSQQWCSHEIRRLFLESTYKIKSQWTTKQRLRSKGLHSDNQRLQHNNRLL